MCGLVCISLVAVENKGAVQEQEGKEEEAMAFGVDTNSPRADAGLVRGIQKKIACECWFTSTGRVMPLMVKLQDEEGEIQTIREITVHSQERKRYAGIPSIEYDCTLVLHGQEIRAWLIYYQSENQWVMNFR